MIKIVLLVAIFATFSTPAYAYIDAGIGSLILQSLVASFFTFMVMWRSWLDKVKNFFGQKAGGNKAGEPAAEE